MTRSMTPAGAGRLIGIAPAAGLTPAEGGHRIDLTLDLAAGHEYSNVAGIATRRQSGARWTRAPYRGSGGARLRYFTARPPPPPSGGEAMEPIHECCAGEPVEDIVRANGTVTIKGVKLLGEKSRNPPPYNHEYPRSTREAAIGILEGMGVFVDHGPRPGGRDASMERSYRDRMGVVRKVRESGTGLFADWSFPEAHLLCEQAIWDAVNAPQNLGFSIRGQGNKRREGRRVIVESLELESVDLVSRPATTGGLREGRNDPRRRTMRLRQLIERLRSRRPGYARALREQAESGVLSDDMPMDEPDAPEGPLPGAGGEAADYEQAIRDAAKAVIDDTSLSSAEQITKIKKLLSIIDGGNGGNGGNGGTAADAEESLRRRRRIDSRRSMGTLREGSFGTGADADEDRKRRVAARRMMR